MEEELKMSKSVKSVKALSSVKRKSPGRRIGLTKKPQRTVKEDEHYGEIDDLTLIDDTEEDEQDTNRKNQS